MKKSILRKYAKLIVRTGANVQKGQPVVISSHVDDAYFTQLVVEEAYKVAIERDLKTIGKQLKEVYTEVMKM